MWLYRHMLKIPWTSRVSNPEVLNRVSKEKEVLYEIKWRKLQYFGHVMKNEKFLQ